MAEQTVDSRVEMKVAMMGWMLVDPLVALTVLRWAERKADSSVACLELMSADHSGALRVASLAVLKGEWMAVH